MKELFDREFLQNMNVMMDIGREEARNLIDRNFEVTRDALATERRKREELAAEVKENSRLLVDWMEKHNVLETATEKELESWAERIAKCERIVDRSALVDLEDRITEYEERLARHMKAMTTYENTVKERVLDLERAVKCQGTQLRLLLENQLSDTPSDSDSKSSSTPGSP